MDLLCNTLINIDLLSIMTRLLCPEPWSHGISSTLISPRWSLFLSRRASDAGGSVFANNFSLILYGVFLTFGIAIMPGHDIGGGK